MFYPNGVFNLSFILQGIPEYTLSWNPMNHLWHTFNSHRLVYPTGLQSTETNVPHHTVSGRSDFHAAAPGSKRGPEYWMTSSWSTIYTANTVTIGETLWRQWLSCHGAPVRPCDLGIYNCQRDALSCWCKGQVTNLLIRCRNESEITSFYEHSYRSPSRISQ